MSGLLTEGPMPRLVVFDLDGTIWDPEMYQLWGGGAPFRQNDDGTLSDCRGTKVRLLGAVREILLHIAVTQCTTGAIASRTDEPTWAKECMRKFVLDREGKHTIDTVLVHQEYTYKGCKTTHHRNLHKKTGVPYEEMVFFDNEHCNIEEVAPLGVHCVYCPDGVTQNVWRDGIEGWRRKKVGGKI